MYKLNIVCIYRSPDGQLEKFLKELEVVIQKLLRKNKILLLCGDWNIDFLKEDNNKKELTDLLLRYNLVNTVKSPTRLTTITKSLLDVISIEEKHYKNPATVIELGLSDHQAQMLPVLNKSRISNKKRVLKRCFRENNIEEFKNLLNKEAWQEVITEKEVNAKFEVFMNLFRHFFDSAFPIEYTHENRPPNKGWVTHGIKNSSKKMRLLNSLS